MPQVSITAESAKLLRELHQGLGSEHDDSRTEAELVDDAIARVHRGFYGLEPGDKRGPEGPTGPFKKWASDRWAEVLLRQIDPTKFELSQPFRYDDGTDKYNVDDKNVTDLASVPRFLTWLIPRYGRHTLAALVHDNLQHVPGVSSEKADVIFRDAMGETGVPLARRWLMWAAVALRTEWHRGVLDKVRVAVWAAIFGVTALLLWPTAWLVVAYNLGWDGLRFVLLSTAFAILAPFGLSLILWGRKWRIGALSGMGLMFFTLQIVFVLFVLAFYAGVEWAVEHVFVRQPAKRNAVRTKNLSKAAS